MDLASFLNSSPQHMDRFLQWWTAGLPYPHSPLASFAVSLTRLQRNTANSSDFDDLFETSLDVLAILCIARQGFHRRDITRIWLHFEETHFPAQMHEIAERVASYHGEESSRPAVFSPIKRLISELELVQLCFTELVRVSLVFENTMTGALELNPLFRNIMFAVQSNSYSSQQGHRRPAAIVTAAQTIADQRCVRELCITVGLPLK